MNLGFPLSISPDDPGKFGYEDTTVDYFVAAVTYKWKLRHLKLIAYHSINHSLCDESVKSSIVKDFDTAWDQWIANYLLIDKIEPSLFSHHY